MSPDEILVAFSYAFLCALALWAVAAFTNWLEMAYYRWQTRRAVRKAFRRHG